MPPGDSRESMTFDSSLSQDGQFMFAKNGLGSTLPGACAVLVGYSANQERFQTWIGGRVASKRRPETLKQFAPTGYM
jgi:hypothetical protein